MRTFNKQSPKTIFITNNLSLTILSTHFSATDIPTPSVLTLLLIQYSLYLFAYSAKEPAPTTSTSSPERMTHQSFCLPMSPPIHPLYLSVSPHSCAVIMISTTLCPSRALYCVLAGFPHLLFCAGMWGHPCGRHPQGDTHSFNCSPSFWIL